MDKLPLPSNRLNLSENWSLKGWHAVVGMITQAKF